MPQAYVVKSTSKILTKYIRHTSNALYGVFFYQQVYFTYLWFYARYDNSAEIQIGGIHRQFFENKFISIQKIYDSNVTMKRKIKIFEESKIDERFNF